MITFIDGTEGTSAAKYYVKVKGGACWVFASKKCRDKQLADERLFYAADYQKKVKTGVLADLVENEIEFEIVPIYEVGTPLKGTDENYLSINPFRQKKMQGAELFKV